MTGAVGRPYDERLHRLAMKQLKLEPRECARCRLREATTIGHVPPLALHEHIAGSDCCALVPECARCNFGDSARIREVVRAAQCGTPSRQW